MSHGLATLIAVTLIVLVMLSLWRVFLLLIMSLFIAVCILGIYQITHFLHL